MNKPFIVKIISAPLNFLVCALIAQLFILIQDGRGQGDIYAFLFWTIPLAAALAFSGGTIVQLTEVKNFSVRLMLLFAVTVFVSSGWIFFVSIFLGGWINAFSFPLLYPWIAGSFVQLGFLLWRLPEPATPVKRSRLLVKLLLFPAAFIIATIACIAVRSVYLNLNGPEKELYLIPDNFNGDFRVVYGEKCGVLPESENGRRVMRIPADGVLIVQEEFRAGTIDNVYYLVDAAGKRTKVNEIYDVSGRFSKPGASVMLSSTGSIAGKMPDESFSSESPLAITYEDFTLFNKDTANADTEKNRDRLDSLTEAKVGECRATVKGNPK
ncbi:MAG TPA: hypothetical protein VFU15_09850 [Bacteroidia bacterium]|nr:hypothetical protein [Bacteroidia bacterium]